MEKKQINLKVDQEIYNRLKKEASSRMISVTALIMQSVAQFIKN